MDYDLTYTVDLAKCDLSESQRQQLFRLIQAYDDIYSKNKYDLGSCDAVRHDIVTTTEMPVTMRLTRVPVKLQQELNIQIDNYVRAGVLRELANLVFVQKKERTFRM